MNHKDALFSEGTVADVLGLPKSSIKKKLDNCELNYLNFNSAGGRFVPESELLGFAEFRDFKQSRWDSELEIAPLRPYKAVELFAGGGGLALGLAKSGVSHRLLNEKNRSACNTLRKNFSGVEVVEGDVTEVDFTLYKGIDLVCGGFPCQSFSHSGKRLGFEDVRGTLFHEFARAVDEMQPKMFLAENVKGLVDHDEGRTLATIVSVLESIGYTLITPKVLKALYYKVPQKRERLFIVGVRSDLFRDGMFEWPSVYKRPLVLNDALFKGELFSTDVEPSAGQEYTRNKTDIMANIPEGGYWRDLPAHLQKDYMKAAYYASGGKTGFARRLSRYEPCLTLTTSPAQKQTERCHPTQTRPLQIREYARIQTFPDSWEFSGSVSSIYKQIGNAVPVELAFAVGRKVVETLNKIETCGR